MPIVSGIKHNKGIGTNAHESNQIPS